MTLSKNKRQELKDLLESLGPDAEQQEIEEAIRRAEDQSKTSTPMGVFYIAQEILWTMKVEPIPCAGVVQGHWLSD